MLREKQIGGMERHDMRGPATHVVIGARIPEKPRDERVVTLGLAGYFDELVSQRGPAGKTVLECECVLHLAESW